MAESPSLPELGAVLELSTLAQPTLSARHAGWRLRLSPHEAAPPPDFHFCLSPAPTGEAGCVAIG